MGDSGFYARTIGLSPQHLGLGILYCSKHDSSPQYLSFCLVSIVTLAFYFYTVTFLLSSFPAKSLGVHFLSPKFIDLPTLTQKPHKVVLLTIFTLFSCSFLAIFGWVLTLSPKISTALALTILLIGFLILKQVTFCALWPFLVKGQFDDQPLSLDQGLLVDGAIDIAVSMIDLNCQSSEDLRLSATAGNSWQRVVFDVRSRSDGLY